MSTIRQGASPGPLPLPDTGFRIQGDADAQRVLVGFGLPGAMMAAVKGEADLAAINLKPGPGGFVAGVPGLRDGLDGLLGWLHAMGRGRRLLLAGCGEGGAVAILGGNLVPGARFIAFDPEPALAPRPDWHPFWGLMAEALPAGPARQGGTSVVAAWSAAGAALLAARERLPRPLGSLVGLRRAGAAAEAAAAPRLFRAALLHGWGSIPITQWEALGVTVPGDGRPSQYAAFAEAESALEQGGARDRRRAGELAAREEDWANPGWQHLRARILARQGEGALALAAAERAIEAATDVPDFATRFARLAQDHGDAAQRSRAASLLEPFMGRRGIAALRDALLVQA